MSIGFCSPMRPSPNNIAEGYEQLYQQGRRIAFGVRFECRHQITG
jgi:hypothetical protein